MSFVPFVILPKDSAKHANQMINRTNKVAHYQPLFLDNDDSINKKKDIVEYLQSEEI